jgi:tetratricopeptide (TPR) repeat protein
VLGPDIPGAREPMPDNDNMEQKYRINRLTETGQLDEASALIDSLMEMEGESAFAYNKLGVIAARKGELETAKSYFEKSLAMDGRSAQAYSNLGNIYREMGDLEKAIDCYRQAIDCDADYATAYHNLGVVYKQKGDIHKAVEHLKEANKLQRVMARRELAESPISRRKPLIWVIIALLVVLLLYFRSRR